MSVELLIVALDLALVLGAALLLLRVLVRRGQGARDLALAILLITLAATLWFVAIRANPL